MKQLQENILNRSTWFIQSLDENGFFWQAILFHRWNHIIGPLKKHVSIAAIKNNTLYLKVSHPIISVEIYKLKHAFKCNINRVVGVQCINKIHII
jgi:hypothetical protein